MESNLLRRTFLTQCSAVGACGAIASSLSAEDAPRSGSYNGPTINDFKPLIGSRFQVQRETGGYVEVELREVNLSKHQPPAKFRRSFSLVFRVPTKERLPQDVYNVRHPSIGSFQPLLVPVDLPAKHNNLEAVFS